MTGDTHIDSTGQTRPSRHLRVGLTVRERSVAVGSIWLVEGPTVQRPTFADPILVEIVVGGATVVLESHPDPRVSRGTMRAGAGHSGGLLEEGTLFVSVPFSSVADLGDVRIRLTNLAGVTLPDRHPAALAQLLDHPVDGMRAVYQVDTADLRAAADWPDIARQLGIPASAGRFEIYVDRSGRYRWRLRRSDGQIVADSGQGYAARSECEADLAWVRTYAASSPVVPLDITQNRPGE